MTAPSVPRVRARKPKVRSGKSIPEHVRIYHHLRLCSLTRAEGCVTCKSRRIKCDEERPICRRCQKGWLPCGYNSSEPNKSEPQTQKDIVTTFQAGIHEGAGPRLLPRVRASNFAEPETLYFDLFRNTIVANLCLNGYTNLWSRTILRESFRDECVRDCVLGIGALRRAMMDERQLVKPPGRPLPLWTVPTIAVNSSYTKYQRDAIQYYTKSISKFRERMAREGSSTPMRTILIVSILFVMFEAMQGDTDSVDRIMFAARLALKDCLTSLGTERQVSSALDDEGVREADYFLTRFSGYNSLLSPFYPSLLREQPSKRDCGLIIEPIPHETENPREVELIFERYTTSALIWCFRTCQATIFGRPLDIEKNRVEQVTILSHANKWCKFLEKRVEQETDPSQRRTWKIMLVEAKMFTVYTTYSYDAEERELLWDARMNDCREVVDLVESILEDMNPITALPPLFEDKLVPTLRCIACKCRDYGVRTRALALSKQLAGPWLENRAVLVGLEILMELEERDRDASGFIPLRSRYRWNVSSWNEDRSELRMVLMGITTGIRTEVTIRQDGNIDEVVEQLSSMSVR
ncbi:hypothetical protein F5Y13DRAFT_151089 [Hypoxylon sp. FL1857]|nr:hypothetical protein F5Y13DRAFT_151089 [Hypoxylon sp. FL1857]